MWEQINLCCKKVPAAFIQKVLDNDCRYLSLANSRVNGKLDLTKEIYPVKYLDLSNCDTSEDYSNDTVLEELVGSCYSLQKLSLSKLTLGLHSNMVQNIVQNGFTLKVKFNPDNYKSSLQNYFIYIHFSKYVPTYYLFHLLKLYSHIITQAKFSFTTFASYK